MIVKGEMPSLKRVGLKLAYLSHLSSQHFKAITLWEWVLGRIVALFKCVYKIRQVYTVSVHTPKSTNNKITNAGVKAVPDQHTWDTHTCIHYSE